MDNPQMRIIFFSKIHHPIFFPLNQFSLAYHAFLWKFIFSDYHWVGKNDPIRGLSMLVKQPVIILIRAFVKDKSELFNILDTFVQKIWKC